jgi:predicted trehalose synthase
MLPEMSFGEEKQADFEAWRERIMQQVAEIEAQS